MLDNIRYDLSDLSVFSGKNYAEFSEKVNSEISRSISSYRKKIQEKVNSFWEDGTLSMFILSMYSLVEEEYYDSWMSGLLLAGISQLEMGDDELLAMKELIRETESHIDKLGSDILQEKMSGGSLSKFNGRLNIWANGVLTAQNMALMYASSDPKLEWQEGDTIEKCKDCLYYSGKVKRASTWMKIGINPQSPKLECSGINCLCRFVPTGKALTK